MINCRKPEAFHKKWLFLKSFSKFTGKCLCQSLLFNIVAGLRLATLLKKILLHRCFPVNLRNVKNTIFTEYFWVPASEIN